MDALIDELTRMGVLRTRHIIEAFRSIDRADFVPDEYKNEAHEDYPLPIGYGQTISQPYTVAFMIELLSPGKGENVLDVGSGSGWTTALLSHCVGEKGSVIGLEIVPELVSFGKRNLKKYGFGHAEIRQAEKGGGPLPEAPFEKILVSAAAEEMPQQLVDQLKIGGVMVIPVRSAIWRVEKRTDGSVDTQVFEGFAFVPLVK